MKKLVVMLAVATLIVFGCTTAQGTEASGAGSLGSNTNNTYGNGASSIGNGTGATGSKENNTASGNGSAASGKTITLTMEEIAKHSAKGDCWILIEGTALNLSEFTKHPGGDAYVPYCGKDGTSGFETKAGKGKNHSQTARDNFKYFALGKLGETMEAK